MKESLLFSIFSTRDGEALTDMVLTLTSASDLFFFFECTLDNSTFSALAAEQDLHAPFPTFPALLQKLINTVTALPESYIAQFTISPSGSAVLSFQQNLEWKIVPIVSLTFNLPDDATLRAHVTEQWNLERERANALAQELGDLRAAIKTKSPVLAKQLFKQTVGRLGPPRSAPWKEE